MGAVGEFLPPKKIVQREPWGKKSRKCSNFHYPGPMFGLKKMFKLLPTQKYQANIIKFRKEKSRRRTLPSLSRLSTSPARARVRSYIRDSLICVTIPRNLMQVNCKERTTCTNSSEVKPDLCEDLDQQCSVKYKST